MTTCPGLAGLLAGDRSDSEVTRALYTDLLTFNLRPRKPWKTSDRRLMKAAKPVIIFNGVLYFKMTTIGLQSMSEREKNVWRGGKKEVRKKGKMGKM